MKIIIPLAGKGTRLLPLTKRVPKPLVRVAGRPVLDYVMDILLPLERVSSSSSLGISRTR